MKWSKCVVYLIVTTILMSHEVAHAQSLDEVVDAVARNATSTVSGYLERGLDPDTTDTKGNTLLMLAARLGHEDMVKLLIRWKARPDRRNAFGDTALGVACLEGHSGVAKLLVSAGASVNVTGWTALHYAAFGGNTDLVNYLLDNGANKDAVAPNGYTALMLAVRNGFPATVRALLYRDPDLTVRAPGGETALSIAQERGESGLVDLLRRAGAVH